MTAEPAFLVLFDGVERGPFSTHELSDMVSQKILTPGHLCSPNALPRTWTPIRSCIPASTHQDETESGATSWKMRSRILLTFSFAAIVGILFYNIFKIAAYQQVLAAENKEATLEGFLNNPDLMVGLFIGAVICGTIVCAWIFFIVYRLKKR